MRMVLFYSFSLWEKAGMRAGGPRAVTAHVQEPSALTPPLSQGEREKDQGAQ